MPLPTTKGPIKDTKRTRVRFDRIVAPCSRLLPISLVHSMNARKCAHAQKPYPSQAFAQSSKAEKKEGEARTLMERKAAQQNKNLTEELPPSHGDSLHVLGLKYQIIHCRS